MFWKIKSAEYTALSQKLNVLQQQIENLKLDFEITMAKLKKVKNIKSVQEKEEKDNSLNPQILPM